MSEDVKSRVRLITVPPLKDEAGWKLFCLGINTPIFLDSNDNKVSTTSINSLEDEEQCEGDNQTDEMGQDSMSECSGDVCDKSSLLPQWTGMTCVEPSTSLLLQFDQVLTQRVLSYHISWASKNDGNS